jgi:hypothetical protein
LVKITNYGAFNFFQNFPTFPPIRIVHLFSCKYNFEAMLNVDEHRGTFVPERYSGSSMSEGRKPELRFGTFLSLASI